MRKPPTMATRLTADPTSMTPPQGATRENAMVDPGKPSVAKSMGEYSTIMARDGHEFQAWLAAAPGRPRGALLVIQEIFGVNSHIPKVTDGFAADGYTAIAPCLFDRVRRGIELGYSAAEMQEGSGYLNKLTPD